MVGQLGHIGIAKEAQWGSALAATEYVEALSESIVETIARFKTRNIIAGLHEPDDAAGVRTYEGDSVFAANPANFGHFLNGALGVNSISEVASGVLFLNEFTPATTIANSLHPLPPYTLEVFRPGASDTASAFQFSGVQFNTLQMGVAPNQDLRVTAGLMAKTRNGIAKTTPSFPGSPVAAFHFDTASISLGGSGIGARIEALTVNFDNQLESVPALDQAGRSVPEISKIRRNGAQQVRLSGTLEFEDFTDYDAFRNQTEQRVVASFFRASSFQLVIDVPRAIFTEYPVQIPGRGRLTVDFSMMGRYHTGSANALKVSLTTTNTF